MQAGQTVAIRGASSGESMSPVSHAVCSFLSGTGLMGVQLAKALGAARVIGVCSGKNADRVTQVGADQIIDYSAESWWENDALCHNRVDIVCVTCICSRFATFVNCNCRYDCVGGRDMWTHSHRVLKPWGKFVTIAGDEQAPLRPLKLLSVGASMLSRKLVSFTGAPA